MALVSSIDFGCRATAVGLAISAFGCSAPPALGVASVPAPEPPVARRSRRLCDGDLASLALGSDHACALCATGAIECWVATTNGHLGYPEHARLLGNLMSD